MHLTGQAADFYVQDVPPGKVFTYLSGAYEGRYGIKRYDDRIHFDVRGGCWRSG